MKCTSGGSIASGNGGRMPNNWEREFLIQLAPIVLACRFRLFGGKLRGKQWPKADLAFDLLGYHDYAAEMALLCREELDRRAEVRG